MRQHVEEWSRQQLAEWVVQICVQINQEEQLGSEKDQATQTPSAGGKSLKNSDCKNMQGLREWEKLPASQESSLERPTGS